MNDELAEHSDDARELVFDVGKQLGFDGASCNTLINVTGNPISALKYLVAAAVEARKLADLQRTGLLVLPESNEAISIQGPKTLQKRTRSEAPAQCPPRPPRLKPAVAEQL